MKVLNVFVDRDICIGEFADILILIHGKYLDVIMIILIYFVLD